MSVLWMDDPSFYNTAQIAQRYEASGGSTTTVGSGTGRFGGGSIRGSLITTGATAIYVRKTLPGSIATGTLACSFKMGTTPTTTMAILALYDSGTVQIDLRINTGGQLLVTRAGTQIGSTSVNALTPGVWYRIEFQATINNTTGNIEVRVNGTSTGWIPSTGSLDTQNTANATFNQALMGGLSGGNNSAGFWDFNDFVVTDSNSPNAGFLGDKRCFLRMPNGNSAVQWTPTGAGTNWQCVSETPADDDTTYNADSTPNDVDLFTLPNLPAGAQNISAVDNVIRVRKDDAGTRTIQGEMKSSTTVVNSASLNLSTSYAYLDEIQETDPATSAAWTASGANALLVGYKEIA